MDGVVVRLRRRQRRRSRRRGGRPWQGTLPHWSYTPPLEEPETPLLDPLVPELLPKPEPEPLPLPELESVAVVRSGVVARRDRTAARGHERGCIQGE